MAQEKNTNDSARKKYYVDASEVHTSKKRPEKPATHPRSVIIDSSKVAVSGKPVRLRQGNKDANEQIRVNVVRDGNRIKSIRITCPCGRHAELDCEYAADETKTN